LGLRLYYDYFAGGTYAHLGLRLYYDYFYTKIDIVIFKTS